MALGNLTRRPVLAWSLLGLAVIHQGLRERPSAWVADAGFGGESFDGLVRIAREQVLKLPEQALQSARRATDLARAQGEKREVAVALLLQGEALRGLGRFPEAIEGLAEAEALADHLGDPLLRADVWVLQARVLQKTGGTLRALDLATRALGVLEPLGEDLRLANCLNIVATEHNRLNQADLAEKAWRRALELAQRAGDQRLQSAFFNNLGVLAMDGDDPAEAERCFFQTLRLTESLGNRALLADPYNNLGLLWASQGDRRRAEPFLVKAVSLWEETGNRHSQAQGLNNLAEFFIEAKQVARAQVHLRQAQRIAEASAFRDVLAECSRLEADLAFLAGDYRGAFEWQRKATEYRSEVFTSELASRVAELTGRFEVLQKDREILLLRKDQAIHRRTRWLYILAVSGSAALVFLVWNRTRLKMHAKREIERRNRELEELNRQKSQFMRMAAHDLRSPLGGIVMRAELLEQTEDPIQVRKGLDQIRRTGLEMSRLLGRYLDIEAIEAGELKPRAASLDPEAVPARVDE